MHKPNNIMQHPSRANVWLKIPKAGKHFGGTGVVISGLLKLTHTYNRKSILGLDVFLITWFTVESRSRYYGFGSYVKVLTVCKAVPAVNATISMDSKIVIVPLEIIDKNVLENYKHCLMYLERKTHQWERNYHWKCTYQSGCTWYY